jgi:hypothetical protein
VTPDDEQRYGIIDFVAWAVTSTAPATMFPQRVHDAELENWKCSGAQGEATQARRTRRAG